MGRKPLTSIVVGVFASLLLPGVLFAQPVSATDQTCGCHKPVNGLDTIGSPQLHPRASYFGDQLEHPPKRVLHHSKHFTAAKDHHNHHYSVLSMVPPKHIKPAYSHHRTSSHRTARSTMHVAPFTSIVADGDINIILNDAAKPRVAIISHDKFGIPLVSCCVRNGTLYLRDRLKCVKCEGGDNEFIVKKPDSFVHPLQVVVDMPGINAITLHDSSSLYASNYHSRGMVIQSYSSGSIIIHGHVNLSDIGQYGSGFICVNGVYGRNLDLLNTGSGLIKIAGRVHKLNVRGFANAHIDAKFLRTQDAWVQTTGFSEVAVTVDNALDGYATGNSYVYYYKTPNYLVPFSFEHANVMQMAYWD